MYAPGLEAMVIRSAIVAGSAQPYNRPTTTRTDELQVASVHAEIVGLIRAVRSTATAAQLESAPFAAEWGVAALAAESGAAALAAM